MQRTLTLRRAIAQQWLGALFSGAISVALMAWLARAIGPGEFALLGATLNASLIALVAIEGGWSALMYREISRMPPSPGAERLPGAGIAHAVTALVPCTMVVILVTPSIAVTIAAMLCMFAVALMNQRSSRMRAAHDFSGEALWQLGGRVSSALAIVGVISWVSCCEKSGTAASMWVFLAWALGLAICLIYSARRWWRAPDWRSLRTFYPLALSMLTVDLGVALMTRGDLVLLSTFDRWRGIVGDADLLAGYAASVRLVEAVLLVAAPLSNVVIAYLRTAVDDTSAQPRRRVAAVAFAFWLLGWMLWGLGAIWSAPIFNAAFGAAFVHGAPWLKWASLPLPWMLANLLLLQAAIAVAPARALAISVVSCALVFVVVSALLLNWLGATGVAIGAALAQTFLSAWLTRFMFARTTRAAGLPQ